MHKLTESIAVTSKSSANSGIFSNILGKIKDYLSPYIAPVAAGFLASRGMPGMAAGLMYGAGYESKVGAGYGK
jgi:hypothetical protein